jgi:hypothetical protein
VQAGHILDLVLSEQPPLQGVSEQVVEATQVPSASSETTNRFARFSAANDSAPRITSSASPASASSSGTQKRSGMELRSSSSWSGGA